VHGAAHLGRGGGLRPLPTRSDLHARDHQETSRFFEERAVFGKWFQADFFFPGGLAALDPRGTEAGEVFFHHRTAAALHDRALGDGGRFQLKPALALCEDVVVRHREEVVAFAFEPVGDHLGIIVAIAPERVRVEVALEPTRGWIGGRRGGVDDGEGAGQRRGGGERAGEEGVVS
jgi:hypothetical protein